MNNNLYIDELGNKTYRNNKGQFHRVDGPAIEDANGTKQWWINNKWHRLDGPAIEYSYGSKEWYINDKRHRLDGPGVEYVDGDKEWWVNHYNISSINYFLELVFY